jgi:hypothetical protein
MDSTFLWIIIGVGLAMFIALMIAAISAGRQLNALEQSYKDFYASELARIRSKK